eukprot:scaffold63959_cov27-Tisochrysis_lutea.AAC.1
MALDRGATWVRTKQFRTTYPGNNKKTSEDSYQFRDFSSITNTALIFPPSTSFPAPLHSFFFGFRGPALAHYLRPSSECGVWAGLLICCLVVCALSSGMCWVRWFRRARVCS